MDAWIPTLKKNWRIPIVQCFYYWLVCGVGSQVVCSEILLSGEKGQSKEKKCPCYTTFYLLFIFLQHPFFPPHPSASSVGSHFPVGAERRSPPLSSVISLLKPNRQSSAAVHVFFLHLSHILQFSPSSSWACSVLVMASGSAVALIGF